MHQITNPSTEISSSFTDNNNHTIDEKAFWDDVIKDMVLLSDILKEPDEEL